MSSFTRRPRVGCGRCLKEPETSYHPSALLLPAVVGAMSSLIGRDVERAVICVLHALIRLPFSNVKGAKIHFDRCPGTHQDVLSATQRTGYIWKNGYSSMHTRYSVSYSLCHLAGHRRRRRHCRRHRRAAHCRPKGMRQGHDCRLPDPCRETTQPAP